MPSTTFPAPLLAATLLSLSLLARAAPAPPAAAAAAAAVNLTGRWKLMAAYDEEYDVAPAAAGAAFAVRCAAGPCSSWKTATVTVLDEGARTLSVLFDSGFKDSGVADAATPTATVTWGDNSAWARVQPPGPLPSIVVHVCPSTHVDPGWFQTLDDLYEQIFRWTVLNVTSSLAANPARTYAAEIAVIWGMYVGEFGAAGRAQLSALVGKGQLEFVGGGWVQPDEAITRFEDLIDERTLGHAFLASVLGHKPVRVGYSADPFGHSASSAYLAALNAYDAHVLGRPMSPLDPINAQAGALWHPMASAPDAGAFDAASTVLSLSNGGYWEPYRSMDKSDVNKAAATLLQWARAASAKGSPTPQTQVLLILGDDAPLQQPWANVYPHLDAVLAALNANASVNNATFIYSTPSAWAQALGAERPSFPARPEWDMVPLVGNEFPYWVGYYVSRPEFKKVYHAGSAFFRGASALHALARDDRTWFGGVASLLTLWRAFSVAQHHDIITGDCYDNVAEDNALRVRAGVANSAAVASAAAALLTAADSFDVGSACTNLTLSPCAALVAALESRTPSTLTLFNPLARARTEAVSFLSPTASVSVVDGASGAAVPSMSAQYSGMDLPPTSAWFTVAFVASIPPLGTASYQLTATAARAQDAPAARPARGVAAADAPIVLSNALLTATFSSNGTLQTLQQADAPSPVTVIAKLLYYTSKGGSENAWDFSSDGSTVAHDFPGAPAQAVEWTAGIGEAGAIFQELAVVVDAAQGARLRYRLYAGEAHLHVFTSVGPFADNTSSTDAILRLETSVASNATFWTDSNGLELHARRRWARPFTSVNYTGYAGDEPVAINMYPVTSIAVLPDADAAARPALAIVTANSHACTSMADGAIELSMNRNVLDKSGARFTGNRLVTQHNLLLVAASASAAATAARAAADALSNPPLAFAAAGAPSGAAFAPLGAPLPPQLALVGLQLLPKGLDLSSFFAGEGEGEGERAPPPPAASGVLLLRLRHIFQAGLDDPALAAPVTVDLAAVLAPRWALVSVTEMVVDASTTAADARAAQIQWQQQAEGGAAPPPLAPPPPVPPAPPRAGATSVTLAPMEIKTLLLALA